MNQAGHEALQQLALAEHDLRLVANPLGEVVEAGRGLAHPHEADEQPRPAGEEHAANRERGREGERSERDGYRSLLAGRTTACAPSSTRR